MDLEFAASPSGHGQYFTPVSPVSLVSPQGIDASADTYISEEAHSLIRIVMQVERICETKKMAPSFEPTRREWRDLISLLKGTAEFILSVAECGEGGYSSESLENGIHRLSTLSQAATAMAVSPGKQVPEGVGNASTDSFQPIHTLVESSADQSGAIDQRVKELRSFLEKRVDDALGIFEENCAPSMQSDSIEFALSFTPEELQNIKDSNMMRWLNDVLKWQVLDMSMRLKRFKRMDCLRNQVDLKKRIIKQIIRYKTIQASSLSKLEVANRFLDATVIELARDTSNEPTRQMIQSEASCIGDQLTEAH